MFLHEIRKRKANWIGHILRRNCLLQQVIEGKIKGQIEVTRRRRRRSKKLLDDLKDRRGYCQLKEEALDCTVWRNRFGRGFGHVIWQITDDDDDWQLRLIIVVRNLLWDAYYMQLDTKEMIKKSDLWLVTLPTCSTNYKQNVARDLISETWNKKILNSNIIILSTVIHINCS